MDFNDIEAPIKATSRVSRFAPKSSKLKPKIEQVLVPKSEPPSFPSTKVEPREIKLTAKPNGVETTAPTNGTVKIDIESKLEAKLDSTDIEMEEAEAQEYSTHANPMEEDEKEDTVVREIDVYFSPSINGGAKLYVMQFPLRPSWRPYEFDEQCEEVRLKPESSEVEVDLSVDLESSNIDSDFCDKLKYSKQTLSTTWKPPPANDCAVGLLMGDNTKQMNSSTEQKSDDDQGPPLHRFSAIKHFAPEYSDDELLSFLQQHAQLLRGYWVPKGRLLYPKGGKQLLARDYVIVMFHKSLKVLTNDLRRLGQLAKPFLMQFALEIHDLKDNVLYWKFKELPDESFITEFPNVVQQQEEVYKILEQEVSAVVDNAGRHRPDRRRQQTV